MTTVFESLPTTPRAEELIDKAFSRATRAGRAKQDAHETQETMLVTASNILSDNLQNLVTSWPDFDDVNPFYLELADAVLRRSLTGHHDELGAEGVDALRRALSEVQWASRKTSDIRSEYQRRMRKTDSGTAKKLRKQAFARLADVVEEIEDDLLAVAAARESLKGLPDIDPTAPTIVVAGYPNVGKSSFVNAVTNARNEIASYPFTTTGVHVGHVEHRYVRYQLVDTPGLLDRPVDERNDIEEQAVSALTHLADCVLVLVDPSETCGYPLTAQLALRDAIVAQFDAVPVHTIANKNDLDGVVDADATMSVETGDNVEAVLQGAIDAIGYEPELPTDA